MKKCFKDYTLHVPDNVPFGKELGDSSFERRHSP